MNTSIMDNKLGSTSDPLTAIVTEATNNFSESFTWEAPGSLAASFKYSILYKINKSKQSCNPHPLASSSLPLIYACRKVIVHFPWDSGHFKKSLTLPLPPQRKNEKKFLPPTAPKLKRKKIKALWVHAEPSHWLHEISLFKTWGNNLKLSVKSGRDNTRIPCLVT